MIQELVEMVKKLENEKEKDVIIDHRYYRNIIGNKGDNIKEIRDKFNQVQITIPGPGKQHFLLFHTVLLRNITIKYLCCLHFCLILPIFFYQLINFFQARKEI